jgi:uncharacterized protein (DUF2237 family)
VLEHLDTNACNRSVIKVLDIIWKELESTTFDPAEPETKQPAMPPGSRWSFAKPKTTARKKAEVAQEVILQITVVSGTSVTA